MAFSRAVLAGLTGLFLLVGCAQQPTLSRWQAEVDHYIQEQANGDPASLRDRAMDQGSWPSFELIGHSYPEKSTDVRGLLVGHQVIAGQPTMIFLVGTVKHQQLQSLRIAALVGPATQRKWHLGQNTAAATEQYLASRSPQASAGDAGSSPGESGSYLGWPADNDTYELEVNGQHITIREARSGAQWSLALGQK